ncbi:hypothetical protein OEZ85_009435 [Tetradesmus obliquus]|uniref:Peptidase S49 domain-containing protein n=1 Tax=Tetradesmus obliquus TaxID=3088 RepID=A0ABY8UE55_TETOB|nr:hypothetical protein OEZ85_009435 [Tetradesmus obliquus]
MQTAQSHPQQPKRDVMSLAKGYFTGAKRAAGAFIIFSIGSSLYSKYKAWQDYVTLPPAFYLELDLEQQVLVERASSNPYALLTSGLHQLELQQLIQVLHTAKQDARVRGLLAVLGGRENFGGMAQLQELRNALLDFRVHAKGRAPVFAYSNVFGEGGMNGTGVYYLASAADKVFMPPTSMLSLLGFESTQVFVRGLLDKLKVQPEVFRREEYKAALAPLMGTGFDPAHRENVTSLLKSLYDQVVSGIASARRLSPQQVEAAVNAAPLLPATASSLGLLDGLLYRDQVEQQLLAQLPPAVQQQLEQARSRPPPATPAALLSAQLAGPRVSMQRYSVATQWAEKSASLTGSSSSSSTTPPAAAAADPSNPTQHSAAGLTVPPAAVQQQQQQQQQQAGSRWIQAQLQSQPCVAVITAAGPIMQAGSGSPGAGGEGMVESHKLVRVLRAMRENPQVRAVVLRINSPGGSAVASDMIGREVKLMREAGKPVVACMGDVAASGGYYIAAPANKILAQPGTITGSIGVLAARIKVKEALGEYGVTSDTVQLGDNASWASGFHTLTPQQQQMVEGMMDATYDSFLSEVAAGRGMSKEAVRELAKGRVWSGQQAVEAGLVDELGGVSRAVELAKQLAGLPEEPSATQTVEWPPRRVPPLLLLLKSSGALPGSTDQPAVSATAGAAAAAAAAAAARLSEAADAAAGIAAAALVMLHESSNNPSLAIVTCIGVAVLAVNALYAASVLWQLVGVVEWGIRKSLQRFVGMAVVQHAPAERLQLQRAEGQGCGRAAAGASSGCKDVDCSAAADSGKP